MSRQFFDLAVVGDRLPLGTRYRYDIHGPNGFLRAFEDAVRFTALSTASRFDSATSELVLTMRNSGDRALDLVTQPLAYLSRQPRRHRLAPGESAEDRWAIAASGHWYDIGLRCGNFSRRWAGHVETGMPSHSDPALGGV